MLTNGNEHTHTLIHQQTRHTAIPPRGGNNKTVPSVHALQVNIVSVCTMYEPRAEVCISAAVEPASANRTEVAVNAPAASDTPTIHNGTQIFHTNINRHSQL